MTTEKMSEKDALYLYATEPERFTMSGRACVGLQHPRDFLKHYRNGSIILAHVPDEPPKPVRAKVQGQESGRLCFDLPAFHRVRAQTNLSMIFAPVYGGTYVYYLPDGGTHHSAKPSLFWHSDKGLALGPRNPYSEDRIKILWPDEIEFDPAFLTTRNDKT